MRRRLLRLTRDEYAGVLTPPLSDIEVARMWRTLGATPLPTPRRRLPRPSRLLVCVATVAAAAAAFWLVLYLAPPAETSSPAWTYDQAPGHDRDIELPDGSRVSLAPETGLRIASYLPDDLELIITRGAAELSVAATPGDTRRFVVSAGGFDVRGRGARYRVATSGYARIEITVHEGRLEVQPQHGEWDRALTLVGGQSWSSEPAPSAAD